MWMVLLKLSPSIKLTLSWWGDLFTKNFHPSGSPKRAQLSVAAITVRSRDHLSCNVKTWVNTDFTKLQRHYLVMSMIVYDMAAKDFDAEIFPQHTIADLISSITFSVLSSQEKPLRRKKINTRTLNLYKGRQDFVLLKFRVAFRTR